MVARQFDAAVSCLNETIKSRLKFRFGLACHRSQQGMRKLPSNHRSYLRNLLGGAEPVKPRHQRGVQACGDGESRGRNGGGCLLCLVLALCFQYSFRHFLDEQRNAIGPLDNFLLESGITFFETHLQSPQHQVGSHPRQDFFQFAVGKWLKDHPIPASERSWGIARVVQEETYVRLKAISDEAAARGDIAAAGGNERKIGDFWHAAMDTETVARQGLKRPVVRFESFAWAESPVSPEC